jgi:hypothetical protein
MRSLVLLLAVGAAACGQPSDDAAKFFSDGASVDGMLRVGRPEVCANAAVEAALLDEIRVVPEKPIGAQTYVSDEEWRKAVDGAPDPGFSEFQSTDVRESVGEVSCEVNVRTGQQIQALDFTIRRDLHNPEGFVIKGDFSLVRSAYQDLITSPIMDLIFPRAEERRQTKAAQEEAALRERYPQLAACWDRTGDDINERNSCRINEGAEGVGRIPETPPGPRRLEEEQGQSEEM